MGEILHLGSPPQQSAPARLAAVVAGDISVCSQLLQFDEDAAHDRIKWIECELLEPSILAHHGRLVKTTGNGFIAIFDSPLEAARCAIAIGQSMVERNASLPNHYPIEYRIGVNLGDVVIEQNDIYGEGIDIASQLGAIAEPGHVYFSGGIYEQTKHKLVFGYESLSDRKVTDITDPVRIYRVIPAPDAFHASRTRRENILIFLLSFTLLIMASGAIWYVFGQPHRKVGEESSVAQETLKAISAPPIYCESSNAVTAAVFSVHCTRAPVQAPHSPPAQQSPSQIQPTSTFLPAGARVREPDRKAIRGGSFVTGSNDGPTEKPAREVTIKSFAMSQYPGFVREWDECAAACGFAAAVDDDDISLKGRRS